ncbi:MoxR family ATPase [Solibacillus sp. FSL R7-0682]|uniref:AAA family ATPase n=1 Tax=Solibacillus sp. FSL R7-0682 TaxID=2921690 RepID=UPI0030F6EEA6
MVNKSQQVLEEMNKVIVGKKPVIEKIWMAILAQGHILLEDIPGVGKTTLAVALSKVLDLDSKRIQFTPDVVASDVVGFTMYDKQSGEFIYKEGAVMCNLLLGDEINRTSSRTQAALLEAMQEGNVTVDSISYELPKPFHVIATQNPLGIHGTQALPQAQLDRFLVKLSIGYPDFESQVALLRQRQEINPMNEISAVIDKAELVELQNHVKMLHMSDEILRYVTALTEETRKSNFLVHGISPRGALAICNMAKAHAFVKGSDFVTPEDVIAVFVDTCHHRIILSAHAKTAQLSEVEVLMKIIKQVVTPDTHVYQS